MGTTLNRLMGVGDLVDDISVTVMVAMTLVILELENVAEIVGVKGVTPSVSPQSGLKLPLEVGLVIVGSEPSKGAMILYDSDGVVRVLAGVMF